MTWQKLWRAALVWSCVWCVAGCATPDNSPAVAEHVEIERYVGTWYEQGHLEMRQQKGCHGTTATYGVRDDGALSVINRCHDGSWDGEVKEAEAKAWIADPEQSMAKLKVQFFWPFRGDYWIVDLDESYQWAIVGTPGRDYLWLLTREPIVPQDDYDMLVARARAKGYPVEDLIRTPQRPLSERP